MIYLIRLTQVPKKDSKSHAPKEMLCLTFITCNKTRMTTSISSEAFEKKQKAKE